MTQPLPFRVLTVAALALLTLPTAIQAQENTPPAKPDVLSAAPLTHGLAGPYLAARAAAANSDFAAAASYFERSLLTDPANRYLQDSTLVATISAGQMDDALELSRRMANEGAPTQLSGLVTRADLARTEDWDGLLGLVDENTAPAEDDDASIDLLDGMIQAWAQLGAGRASDALASFEKLEKIRGAKGVVDFHLAMARALAGDFEGAAALLDNDATNSHLLGVITRAQILAQLDRRDEAIATLDALPGIDAEPSLLALRAQLVSDLPVSFNVIKSPRDGIAQVFLTFATVLSSGVDPDPLALIHARLATWLAPDQGEARLMVAQLLQASGQFDLAEPEFDTLRELGAVRPAVEMGRIDALARADRHDEAERAARALTADYPELPQAWIALGDLLRQQDKFADAIPAYDRALALLNEDQPETRWFPLYARGIALERSGQFERAEADLKAALEIRPDQASLLNYLGYSWIDRSQNLDEGLKLIQRAVELSPEDGYIQDSLAWAYYRLGRYDEAVAPMEQASLTMSSDPVINDHLGDIYWMVGRKREAEVQWRRALSLIDGPSGEVDPTRVRDKLERGLDAVLADEKAGIKRPPPPGPGMQADHVINTEADQSAPVSE